MSGSAAQEDSKSVAAMMIELRELNRPFMENNLKTPLTRPGEPGAAFNLCVEMNLPTNVGDTEAE
jgi:hypothetical protein